MALAGSLWNITSFLGTVGVCFANKSVDDKKYENLYRDAKS